MRFLIALAIVLAPALADAKLMQHTDLAGLVLDSDAIVVADRVGPTAPTKDGTPLTRYHVVRVLRGKATIGADLDLYDQIYDTRGHTLEARVVMFLSFGHAPYDIMGSGLRVVEGGRVFRFEQQDNPGPFAMVPQGPDPQDQWRGALPQLDLPGLERAIEAAIRRVDAIPAAVAERDPAKRRAAMLALMPPGGDDRADGGFYVDRFARVLRAALVGAGDLEGALMIDLRDHSSAWTHDAFGTPDALVAYASATAHPTELRVHAIDAIRARHDFDTLATVRPMIQLLADADPRVRAAAVRAAIAPIQWISSDAAEQKRIHASATETRAALDALYRTERSPLVVFAIADEYDGAFHHAPPARSGGPAAVAGVSFDRGYVDVQLVCLRPRTRASSTALIAIKDGLPVAMPAFNISPRCADGSSGGGGGNPAPIAPGRYTLAVAVTLDKAATTIPLGTLAIAATGEATLEP